MASNQYANKVVYGGTTLIDLTGDDVTAADVRSGKKFHLKSGAQGTGSMPDGSATAPASISGSSATVSTGTNTLTLTKTVSVTPSVSAGYISSGTAGNSSVSLSAAVTTHDGGTITPGTSNQTIAAGTYLKNALTVAGDSNLVAANIGRGCSIFGISGTYDGTDDVAFAASWHDKKMINDSGTEETQASHRCSGSYFLILPSHSYTISFYKQSAAGTNISVCYYDDTAFLSRKVIYTGDATIGTLTATFTTPANCTRIRLNIGRNMKQIVIT